MKQILYPAADAARACGGFVEKILRLFHLKPKPTATRRYADIDMVTFLVACEQGWNGAIRALLALKGIPELNSNFRIELPEGKTKEWHLPLEFAVRARSPKCASLLLNCGADPKAKCRICGRTPLQHADPVMRFLLKHPRATPRPGVYMPCEYPGHIIPSRDWHQWRSLFIRPIIVPCSDEERKEYLHRGDKENAIWSQIRKFERRNPGVSCAFARPCHEAQKVILPLVTSDFSDEEKAYMLDLILPHGVTYL